MVWSGAFAVEAANDCSGVLGCWPMREMKTPLVPLMVLQVGEGTVSLTFFFLVVLEGV
jgi:hypothetical protein